MIDAECVSQIDETKTEELAKDPEYVKDVAAVVEEWVSFSEKKNFRKSKIFVESL